MARQRRVAVQMQIDQAYKRHTAIFAGIHNFARKHGHWRLIVDDWADYTLPARGAAPSPYDGLVGRISAQGARRARRLGVPAVNVWFNSPARDLPGVFPDFAASGRLRAEHLLSRGFRNFGVVYCESYRFTVVEAESFERTVRAAGCDHFRKRSIQGMEDAMEHRGKAHRDWRRDMRTLEAWLDTLRLPVGLFVHETSMARAIIESCLNRGWRVPEDVAIVAGHNEETICERPEPGITSLEFPYEQIGFAAARLLDRLMNNKSKGIVRNSGAKQILLPAVGIVPRRSTDFHAVDDPRVRRALRFIDENLHRRITIDTLVDVVKVSRRTLTNLFRDKLHRSVAAEIQRLRIERVKRELTSSGRRIGQIAQQVGFGPRTLNEVFRSEVGCSPREYRDQRSLPRPPE